MAKEESLHDQICKVLKETKREGIEDLIAFMEDIGYFTAPASGGNHLHEEGGLAKHSWNVYNIAKAMSITLTAGRNAQPIDAATIAIAALLYDLGKCGDYGKPMYVANMLKSGKQSESKPYKRNPELLAIDHATRSIKLATLYIDLTEDEEFAIRYHDRLYETANYGVKGHETELYMILHWADLWSAKILEGENNLEVEE